MRRFAMGSLAAVLLWLLALPAAAEGELGSVRITAEPEMAESRVTLSYVGILTAGGLQLTQEFGGGFVTGEDLNSRELALWLAEQVRDGLEKPIGRDGTVMFTGLPRGVYLLTQKQGAAGYYALAPMLMALPEEDGSWLVQASPKVQKDPYAPPGTGQPLQPVMAALGAVLSALGLGTCLRGETRKRREAP